METRRKTDLFRFATLRAPQLISKERRALGFVENLDLDHSEIFQDLNLTASLDVIRLGVQSHVDSYSPFETVDEIKAINPDFWDFSLWLAENKDSINRGEIDARINGASLDGTTVTQLWDNIYCDIIREKNPYVRQACIQLLIADNFVRNYEIYSPNLVVEEAENEAKLVKRLAMEKW